LGDPIIQVEGLCKNYGAVAALRGVSFAVEEGEVFGLLGPNGAGKTTTVEILEGMRTPDKGLARVCGMDPEKSGEKFKEQIGAVLQSTSLPDKLRVKEAIDLFAHFYRRRANTDDLLKRFQLDEKRNAFYSTLSGGQKQRLALAMALVNDPQVLFLDEPSAGLDPQARLEIHELVLDLRHEQRTILLTTHYIEEAEKLCDRVAIVDEGRIVAMGTPREIQEKALAHSTIEIELASPLGDLALPHWPDAGKVTVDEARMKIAVTTGRPARIVVQMVKWLDEKGVELADIRIKRPSLEDAFIELTGKSLRE
jgi:ABC-2 type transport system ATP-binding protein